MSNDNWDAQASKAVPLWLEIARRSLGQRAIPGTAHNQHIVAMFAMCGHEEIRDDDTPYCAAGVGAWLMQAGISGSGSLRAVSYKEFGEPLDGPRAGAIAVVEYNGGGAHVGLVESWDGNTVSILGANQGHSRGVSEVNVSRFKWGAGQWTFRWPVRLVTARDLDGEGSRHMAKGKADTVLGWTTTVAAGAAAAQQVNSAANASAGVLDKIAGNPWPWVFLILGVYLIASGQLMRIWRVLDANLGRKK